MSNRFTPNDAIHALEQFERLDDDQVKEVVGVIRRLQNCANCRHWRGWCDWCTRHSSTVSGLWICEDWGDRE